MKLLGSLLIRCVFTKKTEGAKKAQKFVKIGTGKNIGTPEQCAVLFPQICSKVQIFYFKGPKRPFDNCHVTFFLFQEKCGVLIIVTKERKSLEILNQLVLFLSTAIPHKVYPIRNEFFHDLAMLSVLYND